MRVYVYLLACLAFLPGCREKSADAEKADKNAAEINAEVQKLKASSNPQDQELAKALSDFQAAAPNPVGQLWAENNLGWHTSNTVPRLRIITGKAPFYKGADDLSYTEYYSPGGIHFWDDFGDFRNQFKLDDNFIIQGARTIDKSGNLLAECRLRYYVRNGTQGRELEEFHYSPDGKVMFRCKSQIDPDTGFKTEEQKLSGKKAKDYYFIWPVH